MLTFTRIMTLASLVALAAGGVVGTASAGPAGGQVFFGDFDDDGKTDLLWRKGDGTTIAFWLMDGNTRTAAGVVGDPGSVWAIRGVGDVDGDGKSDVILENLDTGLVVVWFMDGTSRVSGGASATLPANWNIQAVGDLNGDGKADFLIRNASTGTLVAWIMDGLTRIDGGNFGTLSSAWQLVGSADFNGDGGDDVLWRNTDTGANVAWFADANGTARSGTGALNGLGTAWQLGGITDLDGNGTPDLVWENPTLDIVGFWILNGVTRTTAGSRGRVGFDVLFANQFDGAAGGDVLLRRASDGLGVLWFMTGVTLDGSGAIPNPGTTWAIANVGG